MLENAKIDKVTGSQDEVQTLHALIHDHSFSDLVPSFLPSILRAINQIETIHPAKLA
jgi:hypothetical protein